MAQRVDIGTALLFHDRGTRRGWVGQQYALAALYPPGKDPVPILQEAGWAPGPVWMGRKSRPYRDSIRDHPVRSQSLYQLSYPAHNRWILPDLNVHYWHAKLTEESETVPHPGTCLPSLQIFTSYYALIWLWCRPWFFTAFHTLLLLYLFTAYMNIILQQGCTNPRHQVTWAAKFCTVVPNISGSSVWNFLHVTLLLPKILMGLLRFLENL